LEVGVEVAVACAEPAVSAAMASTETDCSTNT
jgi:hypothetical protein